MMREALAKEFIKFVIVAPSTLKKFVTGKGNAPKDLMLMEVYKRYGVTFTDDNLCDGFALAKVAHVLTTGDKVTKFQQEVIDLLNKQVI
jgi:crossover junction endodeoxyribonuclease RuvC